MRFPAAKRQLCLVAVTLSLLVALSACGPRSVALKSIPAEVIPEELKDDVQTMGSKAKPLVSNVVWRSYEIKDGRLFAAYTFTQEYAPGVGAETMFCVRTANLDEAGDMTGPFTVTTGPFESFVPFQGAYGSGVRSSDTGEPTYSLLASGYCLDGRVKAIQGTTTEGQTAKTKPSGGFWHLRLDNTGPTEAWARISGIDRSGKPVADLTIHP